MTAVLKSIAPMEPLNEDAEFDAEIERIKQSPAYAAYRDRIHRAQRGMEAAHARFTNAHLALFPVQTGKDRE